MRNQSLYARVSGYSYAQEYLLDWETRTATFDAEMCTEAHSLSMPALTARRDADILTIIGECRPERGATFTILGRILGPGTGARR